MNVAEIAAELTITQETVRRDLDELEAKGLVRRVHGGAIPVEGALFEMPLWTRRSNFLAEKQLIAAEVVARLADAQCVFLDEGSTCQVIAEAWAPAEPVTIVTAALPTALALASKPKVSVFFLGGRIRSNTLAASDTVGLAQLSDLVLDVAVLGANGVSLRHGCTCPDPQVAAMKTAAIKSARDAWLAVDASKINADSFIRFAALNSFSRIFTDRQADVQFVDSAQDLGLEVIRP